VGFTRAKPYPSDQLKLFSASAVELNRASAFWLLFIAIKSNSPIGRNSCPQGKELALAKRHPQDKYLQLAQSRHPAT
jgi:hypothetical protein